MNLRKDVFARRTWLRMASIFLAFAVLCSLFYIPCYNYIRRINRQTVLESHQHRLDNAMHTLGMALRSVALMDEQLLQHNADYRAIQYPRAVYDTQMLSSLRQTISTALLPYDFIAEAGLVRGEELLFTRGQVSLDLEPIRWQKYFSCREDDFFARFTQRQQVLPAMVFDTEAYGSYEAVTAAFRWSSQNDMYFFVTIPTKALFAYLADEAALEDGSIRLYASGQPVAGAGSDVQGECLRASLDGVVHLTAELTLSDAYIDQNLSGMYHLVMVFIIVMAAAMILWIVLFAIAAARPVTRVSQAMMGSAHLEEKPGRPGDLVRGIELLDSKLTDYSRQLDEQKERIRIQTLEKAIYRGLYSAESVKELYEQIPGFPKCWRMMLLQYVADEPTLDEKEVRTLVVEEITLALHRRILSVGRNALVSIFAPEDHDEPLIRLQEAIDRLEQAGVSTSYTLSPYYEDPTLLAEAFQQLEYESIVLLRRPSQVAASSPISMQQLHTLFLALQCGDGDAALNTLKNGVAGVRDGADFFMAQYSYRMIANTLVRIKLESTCNLNDIPIPVFRADHVQALFDRELPDCIRRMTERMKQQRVSQSQSLEEDIVLFISDHIADPQLCRTMVTDHFRISAPTLQKRLEASVGKTFSAYVEDLRLSRAQQYLQDSEMSMQEIAEAVGYGNANSFYKAYRRRFGEAPRAARKG